MSHARVEAYLIRSEPRFTAPLPPTTPGDPIDLSDRVLEEQLGSINRAVERDLLSFRMGDVTLAFDDEDGYVSGLFALFGPDDRWQLRIEAGGVVRFLGVILGLGSVTIHHKRRDVELTAYGISRILQDTSAAAVQRTFGALTVTTATAGTDQLVINNTAGLFDGDELEPDGETHKETVVIKSVDNTTTLTLEEDLANTYGSGDVVTVLTPGYRYKGIDFLVRDLFAAAQIPVAEVSLDASQFGRLAPSFLSRNGFPFEQAAFAPAVMPAPCQKDGRQYQTLSYEGGGDAGTYYLDAPDGVWVKEDSITREWYDWSKFFTEDEAGPNFVMRRPSTMTTDFWGPNCTFDYRPTGTKRVFIVPPGVTAFIWRRDTTDGTSYGAEVKDIDGSSTTGTPPPGGLCGFLDCEYDDVNDGMYVQGYRISTTRGVFLYWDYGAAAWTELQTSVEEAADTGGHHWIAPTWCEDTQTLYVTKQVGPAPGPYTYFVVAFKGKDRLWEREIPRAISGWPLMIRISPFSASTKPQALTTYIRYANGLLYTLIPTNGEIQYAWTADEFITLSRAKVADAPTTSGDAAQLERAFMAVNAARLFGQYRFNVTEHLGALGASQSRRLRMFIGAPFFAGVVEYLDVEEKSVAEVLSDLAVLTNAVFWVDDAGEGHFAGRSLLAGPEPVDITDLVLERSDEIIWDQQASYVKVSGNNITAISGLEAFAASGIEIDSELIPNDAFALTLADAFYDFYHPRRMMSDTEIDIEDGLKLQQLDRVRIGMRRFRVYEVDEDLIEDRARARLLEDQVI